MHSVHNFLLHTEIESIPLAEIGQWALTAYKEGFEHILDENNWDSPLYAVTSRGDVVEVFGHDPDARHASREATAVSIGSRWEWARKLATECVATDMRLFGVSDVSIRSPVDHRPPHGENELLRYTADELIGKICTHIPTRLSTAYTAACGRSPQPSIAGHERRALAAQYEAFMRCDTPPFTPTGYGMTPYTYRAHDLTYESEGGNVILFVDIHT